MTTPSNEIPATAHRLSLLGSTLGPFLALGLVVAFFAAADGWQAHAERASNPDSRRTANFLTQRNLRTICVQTATVAVAALGMTVVIIAGGIDLSAGTTLALCATVLAWFLKKDYAAPLATSLAVAMGCCAGLINGTLISLLRVVPFIITLGSMTFFLGVAKIVAEETTVRPSPAQIPSWLSGLLSTQGDALYFGLPLGVWLTLLLAAMLSVVLRFTVFGRYVYALGSNEATARLCGINVTANKIAIYSLAGFFIGVGGIFQFARLSSGNPISGTGLELKIIAAVVIGGGSLSGGRGTVLGTLTGAAIMAVIASGCTQLGLNNPVQDIILGVIIVAAVTLDQVRQRRLS